MLKVFSLILLFTPCVAQTISSSRIDALIRDAITEVSPSDVVETLRAHLEVLHNIPIAGGGSLLDHVESIVATLGPDPSGKPGGIHHNRTFVVLDEAGIDFLRQYRTMLPTLKKSCDFPRPRKVYRWKRSHAPFSATAETKVGVPGMFGAIGIRVKNFVTRRETVLGPGAQLQFFARNKDARAFERGGVQFRAEARLVEVDVDIAHRSRFGHDSCVTCSYRTALGLQSGAELYRVTHKLR